MICIVCPIGCRLTLRESSDLKGTYNVSGNKCPRGHEYGIIEMTHPTRMLTSTVVIDEATLNRVPVRTDKPIPKDLIAECMDIINGINLEAPVKMGDIVIKDLLNTGVNIVMSRDIDRA